MDKNSFLKQLRRSLSPIGDYNYINDTVSYYEEYISEEIRKGKSEQEVMEELGDPRLIAKSVCASYESGYGETGTDSGYDDGADADHRGRRVIFQWNQKHYNWPLWLVKLIGALVFILVVVLLCTILRWAIPLILNFAIMGLFLYLLFQFLGRRR